jgi:hypothetical protein
VLELNASSQRRPFFHPVCSRRRAGTRLRRADSVGRRSVQPLLKTTFAILAVGNPMTTAAAIDRLVHHSVIVELNVASYRVEQAKRKKDDE